jgi:dienelactone hydrolase
MAYAVLCGEPATRVTSWLTEAYDDAGHSFMTQGHHPMGKLVYLPMHLGYAPDAAADAWRRVFDFFDTHLKPT